MSTPQDPFATPPQGGATPPPPPAAPPPSGPAWGAPAPGAASPSAAAPGYGGGFGQGSGDSGYGAPARPQGTSNGFGIAALVLGLIALPAALVIFGGLLGIVAIVFGVLALGKVKRGEASSKGMPIAGIVLGVVSILIAGAIVAFSAAFFDDVSNLSECITEAGGDAAAEAECEAEFEDSITQ